jgi:hypothetical protein
MKVIALLVVSLLGASIVAIVTVKGARRLGGAAESTGAESEKATSSSDPAPTGPLAETPAQRQRTEQARQLLAAALAIGAAAGKGPAPAGDGGIEAAEAGAEDPHENRRLIVEDIASSGSVSSAWTRAAPAIFAGMKHAVPANLARQIEIQRVECYEKGCLADVSYPDMSAFAAADPIFLQDDAFEGWPGPRGRTGPEVVSGRVEVTWMLMNPNEGVR